MLPPRQLPGQPTLPPWEGAATPRLGSGRRSFAHSGGLVRTGGSRWNGERCSRGRMGTRRLQSTVWSSVVNSPPSSAATTLSSVLMRGPFWMQRSILAKTATLVLAGGERGENRGSRWRHPLSVGDSGQWPPGHARGPSMVPPPLGPFSCCRQRWRAACRYAILSRRRVRQPTSAPAVCHLLTPVACFPPPRPACLPLHPCRRCGISGSRPASRPPAPLLPRRLYVIVCFFMRELTRGKWLGFVDGWVVQ